MDLAVRSRKTGKFYNIKLGGEDRKLVIRFLSVLTITGSLSALTLMSLVTVLTSGDHHPQEILLALTVGVLIAVKHAHTLLGKIKEMTERLVVSHENEHPPL